MTQAEAVLVLETKVQTRGYLLRPSLEPEEINLFLQKATNDFIDQVIVNDHDDRQTSYDYLRPLRTGLVPLGTPTVADGRVSFPLPDDYRDYIKFVATTNTDENGCKPIPTETPVDIIDGEEIDDLSEDSYYGSSVDSPNASVEGDSLVIDATAGFTVTSARLRYYKQPDTWDIENEGNSQYSLPDKAIYRIIDIATVEIVNVLEGRSSEGGQPQRS